MTIQNYTINNLDVLSHKFEVEIREIDVFMTIDDKFKIYFQKIQHYHDFCFVLKRAYDFGLIQKTILFNPSELKQYTALDSNLKIIITSNSAEFDKGLFSKRIKTFMDTGEHAFWGNVDGDHLYIQIGKQYIRKEYSNTKTEKYNTKVLIQPGDFYSSYMVYIDNQYKPKEPLRIAITFKRNLDYFIYKGMVRSSFIY